MEVNEEQAIQITIDHGYDGSEFNTAAWKERGSLKLDRTQKKLVENLKTIFNHVEYNGRGKKRIYILKNKKDKMTERKFNYKGTVASEEDVLMREFIYYRLSNLNLNSARSYKGWAEVLGFPQTTDLKIKHLVNTIKDKYKILPFIYNPKEVVSHFISFINKRNKDVVSNSFRQLKKEGKIKVTEVPQVKNLKGDYKIVGLEEYKKIQDSIKQFVESRDVTYYAYTQSLFSIHKSKKMRNIIRGVNEYLRKEFEIEYLYKSFYVELLDDSKVKKIEHNQFITSYFKRLIKLSSDRQNKKSYRESLLFWQRFFYVNTLALLEAINVDGASSLLQKENKKLQSRIDDFAKEIEEDYIQRRDKKHGFGLTYREFKSGK